MIAVPVRLVFFFCFFPFSDIFVVSETMSHEQELSPIDIINGDEDVGSNALPPSSSQIFDEISMALERSGDSIVAICSDIEAASTEIALRAAFIRFNVLRIIRDTAPEEKNEVYLFDYRSSLHMRNRFGDFLASAESAQ